VEIQGYGLFKVRIILTGKLHGGGQFGVLRVKKTSEVLFGFNSKMSLDVRREQRNGVTYSQMR
jgi:hypothetical protein